MKIRVLSGHDVTDLLSVPACIELMRETMFQLGNGRAVQPLRTVMSVQGSSGLVSMMPAQVGSTLGFKSVTVFPDNRGTSFSTHQAVIGLIDSQTGSVLALVDGTSITELRTAAVSTVATQEMARDDASKLLVVGTGAQGRAHVTALDAGLDLDEIRLWNRDVARSRRVAEELAAMVSTPISVVSTVEDGAKNADIIVTATSSGEPVLSRDWVYPGTHINAVGACVPTARELDTQTVLDSRLIVDSVESAINEAGEIAIPLQAGDIDSEHISGELGSVLVGQTVGRADSDEITIFKSLGLGIQDIAAADFVFRAALSRDKGTVIDV